MTKGKERRREDERTETGLDTEEDVLHLPDSQDPRRGHGTSAASPTSQGHERLLDHLVRAPAMCAHFH